MRYRFEPGSLVYHRARVGIVISKHGSICPWYLVEFHGSMPSPTEWIDSEWDGDPRWHRRKPEWHYEVALEPLRDWHAPLIRPSLLRRLVGFQVHKVWLDGYSFGFKKGQESRDLRSHFRRKA